MRIGVVGDLHAPFVHPMYLRFCRDVFDAWQVSRVHFVGDIVDNHALGFWEHDPDGQSPSDEAINADAVISEWREVFPKATVCVGNHDARHFRVARRAGLPSRYLRDYSNVFGTPGWRWDIAHTLDGVRYEHGTGISGKDGAYNHAIAKRTSLVIGHLHTYGGVKWHTNHTSRIFALNAGCGVDCRAYAFEYGRAFANRPTLGCGVVIDGEFAYFEPMPCGVGQRYHRSRS